MKYADVIARLENLPNSFRRQGLTYQQLENAFAAALTRYTDSMDGLTAQETVTSAAFEWLNMQGDLYGIPRFSYESAATYLARIQATLKAPKGTPVAIESYMRLITGQVITVTEQTSVPNYFLTVSGNASTTVINQLNGNINFVRPAGVPFYYSLPTGGLYASTVNYAGRGRMTGSYLVAATTTEPPTISGTQNSALPLLPSDYLTDPTINPSLAA